MSKDTDVTLTKRFIEDFAKIYKNYPQKDALLLGGSIMECLIEYHSKVARKLSIETLFEMLYESSERLTPPWKYQYQAIEFLLLHLPKKFFSHNQLKNLRKEYNKKTGIKYIFIVSIIGRLINKHFLKQDETKMFFKNFYKQYKTMTYWGSLLDSHICESFIFYTPLLLQ